MPSVVFTLQTSQYTHSGMLTGRLERDEGLEEAKIRKKLKDKVTVNDPFLSSIL